MNGRDGGLTAEQLHQLRAAGRLAVEEDQEARWLAPVFRAARLGDEETLDVMRSVRAETGLLVDPHTAVGIGAARACRESGGATVCLATAHPAKFADAVQRATGLRPALPGHLADLIERPERTERVPAELTAVEAVVERAAAART
jgi:threonine synthase